MVVGGSTPPPECLKYFLSTSLLSSLFSLPITHNTFLLFIHALFFLGNVRVQLLERAALLGQVTGQKLRNSQYRSGKVAGDKEHLELQSFHPV